MKKAKETKKTGKGDDITKAFDNGETEEPDCIKSPCCGGNVLVQELFACWDYRYVEEKGETSEVLLDVKWNKEVSYPNMETDPRYFCEKCQEILSPIYDDGEIIGFEERTKKMTKKAKKTKKIKLNVCPDCGGRILAYVHEDFHTISYYVPDIEDGNPMGEYIAPENPMDEMECDNQELLFYDCEKCKKQFDPIQDDDEKIIGWREIK